MDRALEGFVSVWIIVSAIFLVCWLVGRAENTKPTGIQWSMLLWLLCLLVALGFGGFYK